MRKHKNRKARKGVAKPVDVVVGDKRKHIGLVSIENNGRDERGQVIGANGMKWKLA